MLQTFGVILVCVFHSLVEDFEDNFLYRWIHIFVIPLFFSLSGYLFNYTHQQDRTPLPFFLRKAKRLLLPYFLISTFVFVPKVLLSSLALRPVSFSWSEYFHMLLWPYDNVIVYYWFIPTLFLVLLLAYVAFHWLPKAFAHPIPVLIALVCLHIFNPLDGILFLNLGGVAENLLFFFIGYYSYSYSIPSYLTRRYTLVSLLALSLSIRLTFGWGNHTVEMMGAIVGIIMSAALGTAYLQRNCSFLRHLEGAYFTIYLLSWFPQVFSYHFLHKVCHIPLTVTVLLSIVLGIYIPLGIHRLLEHYNKRHQSAISSIS